jgi:hypothetical protein
MNEIRNYIQNRKQDYSSNLLWSAYFGEFNKGNIEGYGELWMSDGRKIISKWVGGNFQIKNTIVSENDLDVN